MQMTIARWTPPVAPTRQEQFILKRLGRVRKLLGFLRLHRHELFDDVFQNELASMYRTTGAGKEARPPAMMAMAMLVQGYLGISDAEMIELTVLDLRVQMVLGCLGAEEPPFSQGALQEFRDRLIAADLDRRLLETHRRIGQRHEGSRPPQAAEDPARGDRFESTGRRGTRRRHVQPAGPRGATGGPLCGRLAWVDRREGLQTGGHSLARGVEHQTRARYRLERCRRKADALKTFTRQLDALQSWIEPTISQ
jgi:hypothetical protein